MSARDADRASLIEKAAQRLRQTTPGSVGGRATDSGPGFGSTPPREVPGDRTNDPVQQSVEVPIDLPRLRAQGYLTPDTGTSALSEEFRIIKRPLLYNAFGQGAEVVPQGNLILVTSALPGEGKTFTAMNLAMSIAMEMDKTVLLVDADVGRARIHDLLRLPRGPGLIELLAGETPSVADVLVRTNVPKLRVIPVGRIHPYAAELLASENMRRLTRDLETRYRDRVVIFDAPPILAASDPAVLSGLVGQVVFVVNAGVTPQRAVLDALNVVDQGKPVGMVLNRARESGGPNYYGYGTYGDVPRDGAKTA